MSHSPIDASTAPVHHRTPIAVTGMGCWYPGARNPLQLWENVLSRRLEFRSIPDSRLQMDDYYDQTGQSPDSTYARRAAVIDGFSFDWPGRRIPKSMYESTDIVHWLAIEVAEQALLDAGYTRESVDRTGTGVFVGNTLTGDVTRANCMRLRWPFVRRSLEAAATARGLSAGDCDALTDTMEELYKSVFAVPTEDTLAGGLANTIAGRICNYFDLHGGGYIVDGACSSSLLAICSAARALSIGDLDVALVGGIDISIDPFELVGFARAGALSPDNMHVYDKRASGFIPGEGCGFVVLKRLEDARREENEIYAVVRGWGISSDGKGGIMTPTCSGQELAIRRAYAGSGYSPQDLDFVEGHGTGTRVGDQIELEAISAAMSTSELSPTRRTGVTSFKSIVGHTKAAAGIGAFIKAAIAVNRRVLPPTASCDQPSAVFDGQARSLYPIIHGKVVDPADTLRAGVSAMGFGGINSHVTLESADAPLEKLSPSLDERALLAAVQSNELFVFTAVSLAELSEKIREWTACAERLSVGDLVDLAAELSRRVEGTHPLRAAVIAATPDEFAERLKSLESLLAAYPPDEGEVASSPQRTVWVSHTCTQTRVGFVFPGQGSQQLRMAQKLVGRFPWARELLETADRIQSGAGMRTVSEAIFPDVERAADRQQVESFRRELARTEIAQPAICTASVLYSRFLKSLGITPLAVGGHSLGELTALHVAGAFDFETLLRLVSLRGRTMAASADVPGAMAALQCSEEEAESLVASIPGYSMLANINSPKQVVVSGEEQSVLAVIAEAAQQGIQAVRLSVSNAFHSDLVAPASDVLRQESSIPRHPERLDAALFSCTDGAQVDADIDLPEYIAAQVVHRVDFVSMIEALEPMCDMLVEVGPDRVLSGLAEDILGWSDVTCLPTASHPDADADLNKVIARAFVHGIDIRWEVLYEGRVVRPFVPVDDRQFIGNPCERPFATIAPVETLTFDQRGAATDGVVETLAKSAGIDPERLARYLERRGEFLGDVIAADLRSMTNGFAHGEDELSVGEKSSKPRIGDRKGIEVASLNHDPLETSELESRPDSTGPASNRDDLETLIVDIVHRRTGFPIESITMDLRLLDDLNLDSIKAGDIIATVARQIGAIGPIDPASLANATLGDVVSVVRNASPKSPEFEGSASVAPLAVSRAADSSTGISSASRLQPDVPDWVRSFAVEFVRSELDESVLPDMHDRRCRLLYEPGEADAAAAIADQIAARGATVELATFDAIDEVQTATHFVAVLPRQSCPLQPHERLQRMIDRLRSAVARTNPLTRTGDASGIAFVQWGGGRFGTDGAADIEACSAAAFARSLHLESTDLEVRVIDLSTELGVKEAARSIVAELGGPEAFRAAGYSQSGERFELRHRLMQPFLDAPSEFVWSSDDVILVTGGGRGITAECALELARRSDAKIALVGSSPHPANGSSDAADEISKTLRRFEKLQSHCEYYACDLTNAEAVGQLVREVTDSLGPITAVLHGAGRNHPRLAGSASGEEALAEVSPKILGAMHLVDALGSQNLRFFVGLTSIIGVTGIPGNSWYAFSNETLDLLLRRYQTEHPEALVRSVSFSAWKDIGMGAKPQVADHLRRMGVGMIPPDEGVARFLHCIEYDSGKLQIVITGSLGELDTWQPLGVENAPDGLRFIERLLRFEPAVELVARAKLTLAQDRYLEDHVYQGSCLFPAVLGLEAMAQAVAYLLGEERPSIARVEDIQLERPILLGDEGEVEIEIRAEATEIAANGERSVHVGLRSELSGFEMNHFAAKLICGDPRPAEREPVATGEPLALDPVADLYSGVLFQGPAFQRWGKTFELNERRVVFQVEHRPASARGDQVFTESSGRPLVLGDPFSRDVLLQSVQALMPQQVGLPLSIERIEFFDPARSDAEEREADAGNPQSEDSVASDKSRTWTVTSVLHQVARQVGEENLCEVSVTDESGRVVERIVGYRVKILQLKPEYPTANQLADLETFDQQTLARTIDTEWPSFGLQRPAIELRRMPELHGMQQERRRELERPMMLEAVLKHSDTREDASRDIELTWLASGKPTLSGDQDHETQISLSHDEDYCLCVVNSGTTGCDIAPVTPRSQQQWVALLGSHNEAPLTDLVRRGEPLDRAGTRIWAAVEAVQKALDADVPVPLRVGQVKGDSVSLIADDLGTDKVVLTIAVSLRRSPERIIAIVSPRLESSSAGALGKREITPGEVLEIQNFRALGKWDGPQDQAVFEHRFVVTFKECATRGRRVQFTQYVNWLGTMRENALLFLVPEMMIKLADGSSGMATNWTDIRVTGEAMTGDVIQARLWMESMDDASVCLCCDFSRVLAGGRLERLAYCQQATTWVRLHDRGEPTREPFPTFLADAFQSMAPRSERIPELPELPEGLGRFEAQRMKLRARANGHPVLLWTNEFDTCLDDANLVGNIYYSRYFTWQWRACDLFLHSIAPEIVMGFDEVREFLSLDSRIEYIRDAFPFDRIRTEMRVLRVSESAAALEFVHCRILPSGRVEKLAVGRQTVAWIRRTPNGSPVPEPFPEFLRAAFAGEREYVNG